MVVFLAQPMLLRAHIKIVCDESKTNPCNNDVVPGCFV